ncbi:MAG: hypothetical protein GY714_23440 [Desulfobacterales bacterium]|nr:hypothetical protein [Desulfobacterales bacterium]
MTIRNLERCFKVAIDKQVNYVGVLVQMKGFKKPEIIINENPNFKSKLVYYKKTYNDDLTLKTFNGIKIINFTYGNTFSDIENDLLNH